MKITFHTEGKPSNGISFSLPYTVVTDSFLDEELDVCPIELKHTIDKNPFPRFSAVSIAESDNAEAEKEYWMIGSDEVHTNVSTDLSDHIVQLVEPTKWLERFIVGNKTVTQPVSNDYLSKPSRAEFKSSYSGFLLKEGFPTYMSPLEPSKIGLFQPYSFTLVLNDKGKPDTTTKIEREVKFFDEYGNLLRVFEKTYGKPQDETSIPDWWYSTEMDEGYNLKFPGWYTIQYTFRRYLSQSTVPTTYEGTFTVAVVLSESAKPRTLKDAAMSMICAAETLKGTNGKPVPRFRLNEAIAKELDAITSPELTVTCATLREALDEIGKCIGAVTVLEIKPSEDGERFIYEINFEKYCKTSQAETSELGTPCDIFSTVSCEDYCTALDATVDNLVQYAEGGAIYDPSPQLWRTPRSEDASYRLTEDSAEIFTAFPIERIDGLACRIYDDDFGAVDLDLKKYLFEASEYAALSSFSSAYPYTKAYALCYTLGQRNITGLNFMLPNAVSPIFQTAALVNIVNKELAENKINKEYGLLRELDFTRILFRVKYVPTGAARVRMRKPSSYGMIESVLTHNQSAAKLDAAAFGRGMFGTVLRMGNKQTTYVYKAPLGAKVPKKGERFGEDGYVSEIREEFAPHQKTVTITVSDGFNRLSQFVGVNKAQRLFEISERLSLDRHIVYEDKCLISTEKREGLSGSILTGDFIYYLRDAFTSTPSRPTGYFATAVGYDEEGNALAPCFLPCIPYGVGNSLTFTISFEDNYGAGRRIDAQKTALTKDKEGNAVTYYAAEADVRYTDVFGRVADLELTIEDGIVGGHMQNVSAMDINSGQALPALPDIIKDVLSPIVRADGANRIYVDKDSREAIKTLTYQISFLEADGIKISPYFAENLPYAGRTPIIAFVPIPASVGAVNNLTEWISVADGSSTALPSATVVVEDRENLHVTFSFEEKSEGWAAVAWNEDVGGNTSHKRFLFGKNGEVSAEENVTVYFNFFH